MAGISSPNASSTPDRSVADARMAVAPVVETVSVAVPVSFDTEIVPTEHAGAGVCVVEMLQVNATPDGLNPFDGAIVMLAVADCPGVTDAGDNADVVSLKSEVTLTALDVLAVKSLSPPYTAVMLCAPSLRLVVEIVAVPFALTVELPTCAVPSMKVTLPVGVPEVAGATLAVNVRFPFVELELRDVEVFAFCTTWFIADDVAPLKSAFPLYAAVMPFVPTGKFASASVATPLLSGELPSVVDPFEKVTVPVSVPAAVEVTVAVSVTDWLKLDGFAEEINAIELLP